MQERIARPYAFTQLLKPWVHTLPGCSWASYKDHLRPLRFGMVCGLPVGGRSWLNEQAYDTVTCPLRVLAYTPRIEFSVLAAFHTFQLLHFSLLHFPPLLSALAFSTPAFSTTAAYSWFFHSCIFHSRIFSAPRSMYMIICIFSVLCLSLSYDVIVFSYSKFSTAADALIFPHLFLLYCQPCFK